MKKSLLLVLVLFMGACSTEPIVKDPKITYYKDMYLKERNEFERSLEGGRWIRTKEEVIEEYTWTAEKGKRIKTIVIDEGVTNSISEMSYELKYDSQNPNQALLVLYTYRESYPSRPPWDKLPIYREIVRQSSVNFDTYNEYIRYYNSSADVQTGPTALKRGSFLDGWNRI